MSRNLGESLPQPESPDQLYEKVTKTWQQELPDSLTWRGEFYESKQKMFQSLDTQFAKEVARAATTTVLDRIQKGEEQATNNFYLWFSPRAAEEALRGEVFGYLAYKFRPFYINERFNNAWSRMCQALPEKVKIVLTYLDASQKDKKVKFTEAVNKSLNKLALFLHEIEGIPPWFLCS